MALELYDFMQMSPVFIAVFMLMTSLFNGDVKALIWIGCAIVGMALIIWGMSYSVFQSKIECTRTKTAIIEIFSNYPNLSISTFFILFTLTYLVLPMQQNKDWNYYVIVGFLGMFAVDTILKLKHFCTTGLGIFSGAVLGMAFSILCYWIIRQAGGDKILYFNTVSSNNIYCSKPKKQQFKCFVYKNGEIISAV
jgi:hypothetical protein